MGAAPIALQKHPRATSGQVPVTLTEEDDMGLHVVSHGVAPWGYLLKEPATLMSSDLDDYRDDVIASLPAGSAKCWYRAAAVGSTISCPRPKAATAGSGDDLGNPCP